MSGATTVVLAAFLFALFCLMVGLLVWQEAKRRPGRPELAYVVDDAVAFITSRLDPETTERIGTAGVRRIIEWEVYYLQGLAQPDRRRAVETVAGGSEEAIAYIADRIADVHGVAYDSSDIAAVLGLEAAYLASIGAVGEPVAGASTPDQELQRQGDDET